ncbi:MAG: class I SAM-dependent methyltransferase [Alphaproteobacteria bacterium]|nr:class I SAM-dependent methyltransferase [Alphaproteobacteria bacterium]MDP6872007.1 class I SAM-dependent methyltransferase [Alphaproteobacteria bacterium]
MAYHSDKVRDYLRCRTCGLVFVPPVQHLSGWEEKAYYDLHENRPDDPGYRRFLERLFTPLKQRLTANAKGLDFGCGPGPTLSRMFAEAGHEMALYDPYYASDKSALSGPHDFITLSEVAEHLAEPGRELDRLWQSLRPGGWLGFMTKRVRDREAFKTWHYITDPTHVCYFSEATFEWLTAHWSHEGPAAELIIAGNDVVLIRKA